MAQAYAKCQTPEITRTALQCETTVIRQYGKKKLENLHRPQCTNPRLLSLVPLYSDAVTEMQVWPKFKSNFLVRTTRQQASKAVSIYTQGQIFEHTRYLHSNW